VPTTSLFGGFVDERLVNVRDYTTTSDSSLDEGIQLLISSDGQLQMPWSNSLHFQILASISSKLKNLCGQVFKDWSQVDSSSCPNSPMGRDPLLQMPVDTTDRELYSDIVDIKRSCQINPTINNHKSMEQCHLERKKLLKQNASPTVTHVLFYKPTEWPKEKLYSNPSFKTR